MKLSQIVQGLPAAVPFVGPDEIERRQGYPFALRLGANESAFGVSPLALEAMREAAATAAWYGDPTNHELTEFIAAHHGVPSANVLIAGGIDELLGLAVRATLNQGDTAVASHGSYPTFAYQVSGFGGLLETVPYRDFCNDLTALKEAAQRSAARIVYLANPDNPTGSLAGADAVQTFLDGLPQQCIPFLDEAYADFVPGGGYLPAPGYIERTVRFRTFSKAHGMAGLRVGYLLGPQRLVSAIHRIRLHFGVNRVAQAGALASMRDQTFLSAVAEQVRAGREDYHAIGRRLGVRTIESSTNFVLFCFPSEGRAAEVVERLSGHRVFVRTSRGDGARGGVRVTVGTPDERTRFAEILAAC